jgi:SAM-dependent methyltransferase
VCGDVLELQTPLYARRVGRIAVSTTTILDIDATNPQATLIADLCESNSLPRDRFDCEIVTQTLQLLPDPVIALTNLWDALAPGGVLLITVPVISRVAPEAPNSDYWRFTPRGLQTLVRAALPDCAAIEVEGHGNAVAGAAFILGLSTQNVGVERIRREDNRFPIIACARVTKPPRPDKAPP